MWKIRIAVLATVVSLGLLASAEPVDPSQFVFPWGTNADPTDVPKSHVQEITGGIQKYQVVQGGTMDGRSCRTPMGVGMNSEGAFFQTWESNRSVRMENVGDADVVTRGSRMAGTSFET